MVESGNSIRNEQGVFMMIQQLPKTSQNWAAHPTFFFKTKKHQATHVLSVYYENKDLVLKELTSESPQDALEF